jgi:ornithine decarboxylase
MTERIQEFLRARRNEGTDVEPCLVVDLEVVRDNFQSFAKALPDSRVFYAVKANPAPEVLSLLASMGSCFDCASVRDPDGARRWRHAGPHLLRQHHQEGARYRARHALGIGLFSVDCAAEVEKIARAAPGARVFCRILYDCAGAEWPLSRKFGCDPEMAVDVLELAKRLGLERLWHFVPCRLAAAQGEGMGPCAGDGLVGVP